MKRLTVRDENGNAKLVKNDVKNISEILLEVIDRLVDYEDLKISAEQVREIDKEYTELCVEYGKYTKLGTVEELQNLKEKSVAKPRNLAEGRYYCNFCGIETESGYCKECGQLNY